ncbi:RHS repeat-associated core domain-containing protein [Breznakiella homolactica]|uniref:DUF4329 domain-containing protein n=1 Tax=Breznakiella homolactica TaxID=2798577 RepID=A0A7T7XQU3_9SPIR|nr:RHS repeat-associated core domain-containing protein [Breznakiella homolactica]QQO10708.1 DUF4329 domain-containing protein [Breznakiella homolactica]
MVNKKSVSGVSNGSGIGSNLNYEQSYQYYDGYAHRVERIGNRYYQYDGNGNVVIERDNGHAETVVTDHPVYEDGHLQYTEYGFALQQPGVGNGNDSVYQRVYAWNERNQLLSSKDNRYTVQYRYGADGERTVKYVEESGKHTLYYNRMWQMNSDGQGWRQSKHVYVGDTRVVTKRNYEGETNPGYEQVSQYWYHGDHLGSAQAVTDYNGVMYERLEYTPYGEVWIEERGNGEEGLPFRFTGKEMDEETGLYYYGARYLDPKMSRWLSTDPAMGEYVPGAPVNEEVRKRNGNLPGMGGVYNYVNLHTYHYAANNPVKYTDPTGMMSEFDSTYRYSNDKNVKDAASVGYDTPREAAVAMIDAINPISIKENVEYGGVITKNPKDGKYYASIPVTEDSKEGVDPFRSQRGRKGDIVGDYHTHGDYSIIDADGNYQATGVRLTDPRNDDFSEKDLKSSFRDAMDSKNPREYQSWLGTPRGIQEYHPYSRRIIPLRP